MIIGLDIDGVLRNFTKQLIKIYKEDFPSHTVLPIDTWFFENSFPIKKDIYQYYKDNADRIFEHAERYENADLFSKALCGSGHYVILVTSQPRGSEIYTMRWVEKNNIAYNSIVFTDKKSIVNADIFLDDSPINIEELRENGKRCVVFDQQWNKEHGGERCKSYEQFMEIVQ